MSIKPSFYLALAVATLAAPVMAEKQVRTQYVKDVSEFFSESTTSVNLNFISRTRYRGNVDGNGEDTAETTNLDHGSMFASLGFNSGYIGNVIGADVVVYGTYDRWQDGSPDHEMNFWNVNNPYDKVAEQGCVGAWDSDCNYNGVSFATASAKFKFGESYTAKAGYFQPSVPGSLAVNWSFAPGTYRGGEIGGIYGKLTLGLTVADEYKAPWFRSTYAFQTTAGRDAGTLYSLGARLALENGTSLDFGYGGLTDGVRKNAQVKLKSTNAAGLYWSPQIYLVEDKEQYASTAFQLAFLSAITSGQYSYRAEATYTSAESNIDGVAGNMAYRLTSQYGGSNGAYDIWWNNRSDFNHDGEYAGFASVSRNFPDFDAGGFTAGISTAFGLGAEAEGFQDLKEYAYSLFLNYAIDTGALKNARLSFYYTDYSNETDAPNWSGYTNLFQDESDYKLIFTIPLAAW
ncbi:MAG: multidrug transporter [Gammaproteobacteria bacterium]|nr:multidrug transporter [Gammaproteobacteria bacterium]